MFDEANLRPQGRVAGIFDGHANGKHVAKGQNAALRRFPACARWQWSGHTGVLPVQHGRGCIGTEEAVGNATVVFKSKNAFMILIPSVG